MTYLQAVKETMKQEQAAQPWAVITGASRGLGKELALAFARQKYNLVLHDSGRRPENMRKLVAYLEEMKILSAVVQGDLADEETISRVAIESTRNAVSALVNNAAVYHAGPLNDATVTLIRQIIAVNLLAPILLTETLMPVLQKRKGIVININSMAAHSPAKGESVYAATKAGLAGFSRAYKLETMPVRIMDVFVGAMNTEMAKGRPNPEMLIKPEAAAHAIVSAALASRYDTSVRVDTLDLRRGWY